MNSADDTQEAYSRRSFLLSTGGLLTTWVATEWPAIAAAAHHADDMAAADAVAAAPWTGFQALNPADARDVEAIAAQIVPSGTTPGARETHAVYFIDRALATFFASWSTDFHAGLGELQQTFRAANPHAASFTDADGETQIAFLKTVDRTPFFNSIRMLTLLGMFSSPTYGGNASGLGWRLIGFEDRHAFTPPFGYYDAAYTGFVPYSDKPA